jgi:muramoyltetrapeptide carboxypeptidase
VHLIAPAGDCRDFFRKLGVGSADGFLSLVRESIGPALTVTADRALLEAREKESRGGRDDDESRARDIESALASDDVVALLAVRGGAWLTRILSEIDFSVLDRRMRPVAVWGFSELTTLVNIVAAHARGRGVYDMGPAFLPYGLKVFAERREAGAAAADDPDAWAADRLRPELLRFFESVGASLTGEREPLELSARLERGDPSSAGGGAQFVGGNLTVLTTLIGTPYESAIRPDGKWLLLEDFNDKPERFDRFLAHLKLAGYFERCHGLLLGDFHRGERDLLPSVLAMLDYHLPRDRDVAVLSTRQVGHTWPMTPLPLHVSSKLVVEGDQRVRVVFPRASFAIIDSI